MHCPKCSVLNVSGAKFCSKCGLTLDYTLAEGDGTGGSHSITSANKSTTSIKSRYEILRELKATERGTLFLAKDKVSQKEVLLKRYFANSDGPSSGDKAQLDIFLRKSLEIQGLNHLNVLSIYHVGHDEEGPFLVTENIDGSSLREFLEEKEKLNIEKTAKIARGIASALAFSHKKGLYHGALNPTTVSINKRLDPKVTDFCLPFEIDPFATDYLAPEQATGGTYLDFRVDVYSLGALIYKISTGLEPGNIDLDQCPSKFRRVIQKATDDQRESRFASMEDFFEALDNLEEEDDDSTDILTANACPMCGSYNGKENQFCSHCGAGLAEECPNCKTENKIGQKKCLRCGIDFTSYKKIQTKILQARSLYNQGNIEDALSETQSVLKIEKGNEEALRLQGRYENHLRELEQELAVIKALVEEGVYKSSLQKLEGLSRKFPTSNQVGDVFKVLVEGLHKDQYSFSLSTIFDLIQAKNFVRVVEALQGILQKPPTPSRTFQFNDTKMQDPLSNPSLEGTDSGTKVGTGVGTSVGSGTMAWHRYDLDEFEDMDSFDRKKRVRKLFAKAKRFFNRYEFGNAVKACKKILREDKRHSGAKTLLKKALQKGKAIKRLAKKAREHEEYDELKKALATWKKALSLTPKHKDIRKKISRLKERMRDEMEDDFDIDGFLDDSEDFLEEDFLDDDDLDDDDLDDDDLDDDFGFIEEEDKTSQLLSHAQEALQKSEFGEAYRLAKGVLELDWDNEKAQKIMEISKTKGVEIKQIIERAKEAEEASNYVKAASLWKKASNLAPSNDTILQKYRALDGAAQREEQIPLLLKNAQRFMDQKEYPDALMAAQDVLKLDPANILANQIRSRAQTAMDEAQNLLLKGRKCLVEKEFEEAIALLEKVLEFYPASREARELLGLAREKYEAGDMDFSTIDMEILLGTHPFPTEKKSSSTEGWDDGEDDFVGLGKNKQGNFRSSPSARPTPNFPQGPPLNSPEAKKQGQPPLQEVDDASFLDQLSAMTDGDTRSSQTSPDSTDGGDSDPLDLGDEFSNLRRKREQDLKDDSTTTFVSPTQEMLKAVDSLLGGSGSQEAPSPVSPLPAQKLVADPLSSLDPEDQATEKIPSPSAEAMVPPESDEPTGYPGLDFLLGAKQGTPTPSIAEEVTEDISIGPELADLADPLEALLGGGANPPKSDSGQDDVASLIEEVESKVSETASHTIMESGAENPVSLLARPFSEEDNLRKAINKSIEEVDQADFADTDKINVQEIGAVLQAKGGEEGLPLGMLGVDPAIQHPTATSTESENLSTGEIDSLFGQIETGAPTAPATPATSFENFFDQLEQSPVSEKVSPTTRLGKRPELRPGTESLVKKLDETGEILSHSEKGTGYDLMEDADTEKIDRSALNDFLSDLGTSGSPQSDSPVSGPEPGPETSSPETNSVLDDLFGSEASPEEEPPSSAPEFDELFGSGTEETEKDGNSTGFLDVLEKALGDDPNGPATSASSAAPATSSSPLPDLSQEPPAPPSGLASGEINAFMEDYDNTAELNPMNLKEAGLRKEQGASGRQVSPPVEDSSESELFAFDWSPDENSEPGESSSAEVSEVVQDLFPGMAPKTPRKEEDGAKGGGRTLLKGAIFILLTVVFLAGGIYWWLEKNYSDGKNYLKNKDYQKAYKKFKGVEYKQFVQLAGRKTFRDNCKMACLGIGKKLLKKGEIDAARNYFDIAHKYASDPREIKPYLQKVRFYQNFKKAQKYQTANSWVKALHAYAKALGEASTTEEKVQVQKGREKLKKLWLTEVQSGSKKSETALKNQIRSLNQMKSFFFDDKVIVRALKMAQYEQAYFSYQREMSNATYSLDKAFKYLVRSITHNPKKRTFLTSHFVQKITGDSKSFYKSKVYDRSLYLVNFLLKHAKFLNIEPPNIREQVEKINYDQNLNLADKAKKDQDWIKAIQYLKKAQTHGATTVEILELLQESKNKLLAQAKTYELNDGWEKAVPLYKFLQQVFPQDPDIAQRRTAALFKYHKELGIEQQRELEWNRALISFQKAQKYNPQDRVVQDRIKFLSAKKSQSRYNVYKRWIKRAEKQKGKKEWLEALKLFTRARETMKIFAKECSKLKKQIVFCQKKWLSIQDKSYTKYFNLGLKKLRGKEPYKSARYFKKALYYKPGDVDATRYYEFSLKLKDMVYVKEGYFLMGNSAKKAGFDRNQTPQNKLYLRRFYIDKYEVTNQQYRKFLESLRRSGQNHSLYCHSKEPKYKNHKPKYWDDPEYNQDNQPVVGVDWYDAYAYARFAGKKLPSEAEWEKAARGTDGRTFPWGNTWNPNALNQYSTGPKKPREVGSYPLGVSPYGCYDMAGNVWEWTRDRYRAYRNSRFKVPADKKNDYVLRGGSWNDYETYLADQRLTETTFRNPVKRKLRGPHIGFRCIKPPLQ